MPKPGLLQRYAPSRKELTVLVLLATLFASNLAAAPTSVPRKSPEFTISQPSGKSILLSSLRGKVVAIEFFFLQSNHCTRVAKMLNKLNAEMGARGFQALGVVFDPPNVPDSKGELVGPSVDFFHLTYPVGYSHKGEVDSFLDRKPREVLNIPQVVIIDRNGMIRAVSGGAGGDPRLEDEASLRALIEELLKQDSEEPKAPRK
jgi:peroxiredoxin